MASTAKPIYSLATLYGVAERLERQAPAPAAGGRPVNRPRTRQIERLIRRFLSALFPYEHPWDDSNEAPGRLSQVELLGVLTWDLAHQIHRSKSHACADEAQVCPVMEWALNLARQLVEELPAIQAVLLTDVDAAYRGDPAARSPSEVISAYPGFKAIFVYRLAHQLHLWQVPLLPRLMTELAHSQTGIDIHPGATIGPHFFIDHGTGVVIGETTVIGSRVTLYQGVTLGAHNFPRDETGQVIRGQKRHPTLEDDVVVYAGATILGGNTVVGHDSIIGGNVWLVESVPPYSRVLARPQVELKTSRLPE